MRSSSGFICVCALALTPMLGCSETAGSAGSGGSGGSGASGGSGGLGGTGGFGGAAAACEDDECSCDEAGIRAAVEAGGDDRYTFNCDGPQTVVTTDVIVMETDVILDGEGNLTVDGSGDHTVFQVEDVTAELRGVTVTGGFGSIGGGIWNVRGTLTMTKSTVSGNASTGIGGSGIHNGGNLTLIDSTVSANTGEAGTGGIYNEGTLSLTNTTVSGNTPFGISMSSGTLSLTNTTVSGNTGGGVRSDTDVGTLSVTNTLIDGNCAFADIAALDSNGYNIESPGNTCGFNDGNDLVNITEGQLDLEPLQDNGGPTLTHALRAGSVAIDHIPDADCQVDADQRDEPRPESDGGMCDVGAFEAQPQD